MDKEYHSGYNKKYYEKNKDKIKQRCLKWRMENPEKVKRIRQKWWIANKQKRTKKHNEWLATIKGYLSRKIYHLKKQKRARIIEVSIDVDVLLDLWDKQRGQCAVSKYPMIYPECTLFSVSVDRIDPKGGYTKDNVQLVCQGINFAKNKYSNQEMLDFWNYRDKITNN